MKDLFQKIDNLKKELSTYQPLGGEQEQKLWRKFRLEWNYNSNHIEGNTLTYGHTEMLLILGKVTGDYELREIEEMKAHDVAINFIRNQAKEQNRDLTEADIRELNKIILVEPFWKEAITPEGQPTKREIVPGTYKKMPNHVKLSNGETFFFASPEETPIAMGELLDWYMSESAAGKLHPAELAALFHYKLVRIHPFDDSNGRTSRLVMNYALLRNNYPPVIIKSSDKRNYFFALSKADTGDVGAIVEYVGKQLLWSLELSLKAAKGESIEELDDVDKEIHIWKREFNEADIALKGKSIQAIHNVSDNGICKLFEKLILNHNKFVDVFLTTSMILSEPTLSKEFGCYDYRDVNKIISTIIGEYKKESQQFLRSVTQQWTLEITHSGLKKNTFKNIFVKSTLYVQFHYAYYEVFHVLSDKVEMIHKGHYGTYISDSEVDLISNTVIKSVFEFIKRLE